MTQDVDIKYEGLKKLCSELNLILMWNESNSQWFVGKKQNLNDTTYVKITSVSFMALYFTPWEIIERKIMSAVIDHTFGGE